ncbi:LysR substrate-binding domain-containing protein [Sphingomonas sp. CCH21-G11]|uniref:LysR substrate-binding domain-containing protein n=1 Tax=Sphingomonas sp. CCH21-G11 TaxID=1768749 RepID=UPI00082A7912|nr:LysR substrate-binding domain-containing protein [Sphingomonas sp. CCH21-G11]
MNLSLIEAFSAVMKTGSTTQAATLLGISQPAISRSLKRLEDTTKLKLFERAGPRLSPTPEASLLYQEIIDTQIGLDRLRQSVARIRSVGTGSLRIASSAALGLAFVPKVLKRFLAQRAEVSVTFEIANSAAVRNLVASGTHDVGLCADEIDRENLVSRPFVETSGVIVMRADHPLASEEVITAEHLDDMPVISLSPDDTARKQLNRALAEAGVSPRISVETQFAASVCQLALEGAGIGLTNSLTYLSGGYASQGLVARPFRPRIAFRSLMILPPHRARSRLVDELVVLLEEERDKIFEACTDQFG